jgi:hypothetical protein
MGGIGMRLATFARQSVRDRGRRWVVVDPGERVAARPPPAYRTCTGVPIAISR